MPKKLLIKSLSASGELLNVVSCFAGQVSVFRAHSPSELKPYQRALAGLQGAEKYNVSVDSAEYRPQNHTLIGFAEQRLSEGLTVRAYLEASGVTSQMLDGILLSYGLDRVGNKLLLDLSSDEERRVRLLEASFHPEKALIINEPFEPISSQWRERFAELLTTFARSKNAVVVITALSYRPECWIDNDLIQRIQVGENIQRTIGFGSTGSQANQLMNQIRDAVRQDAKNERQPVAPLIPLAASAQPTIETARDIAPRESWVTRFLKDNPLAIKATVAGSLVAISGIGLLLFSSNPNVKEAPPAVEHPPVAQESSNSQQETPGEVKEPSLNPVVAPPQTDVPPVPEIIAPPPFARVLDSYPEPIRVSLLNTSNGVIPEKELTNDEAPSATTKTPNRQGNILKLLETASGKAGENQPSEDLNGSSPQAYDQVGSGVSDSEQQSDEQQRREAIRQKFLEAIRAAAERRQQAQEEN